MSARSIVVVAVLAACGKSDATLEAERVAAAIGRMRDAPRTERAPLIDALAALTPKSELAKAAQQKCLTAYRGLDAAHARLDAVQASVARASSDGTAPDPSLLGELVAAEEMLTKAQGDQAGCAADVAALLRSLR